MKPLLGLFLGLVGFYGFFAHGYIENTDAEVTMHAARAWWLRGDPGLMGQGADTWVAERTIFRLPEDGQQGMIGRGGKLYVRFPIGHQVLMLPCVALGEAFSKWFPGPERALLRRSGALWGRFFWTRFFVSFLPAFAAAGSTIMLFLLARALGCRHRQALLVTFATALCTQFWPGSSETMSNQPGLFFGLAMLWLVLRRHAGQGRPREMLLAGMAGGCSVLMRYPSVLTVLVCAGFVLHGAWRLGRKRDLLWFLAGGLPAAVFLFGANAYRFGSPFETGYSRGTTEGWWTYPFYLGAPLILLAPGKGILWFSPPLWIALAQGLLRSVRGAPWFCSVLIGALPILILGHSAGWAAGQCWGNRYMTPGVVIVVAVAFSLGKPWQRRPMLFKVVCGLGLVISLGGVLTPYRGQQQLAFRAAAQDYAEELRSGVLTEGLLPDRVNVHPRYSPLHTHWIYAWLSASGRLARGGSANTTEPLFGTRVADDVHLTSEEDMGFRHFWMLYLHAPIWLVLAWGLATGAMLWWSLRALLSQAGGGCRAPQGRDAMGSI